MNELKLDYVILSSLDRRQTTVIELAIKNKLRIINQQVQMLTTDSRTFK